MTYIETFLQHLVDRQLRRNTITAYQRLLVRFEQHCRQKGRRNIAEVSRHDAISFIDSLSDGRLMTRAARLKLSCLVAYFRFLEERGLIFLSPLKGFCLPHAPRTHYPVVLKAEMEQILRPVASAGNLIVKGKALLELSFFCIVH